jgi:hypothetical protein
MPEPQHQEEEGSQEGQLFVPSARKYGKTAPTS